ncbi:MAG: hypothetical protein J2P26_02220, partial [Nocardiopsaceae bacterium]|nr:hypothetical protein [Nocardiopsaceae bacterium]
DKEGLPGLLGGMEESGARNKTKGALEAAGDKLRDFAGEGQSQDRGQGQKQGSKRRREGD